MRPSLSLLRPPGAAERLRLLVQQRLEQPFAWGVRDCCLWGADAAHACTGTDPAADLRGTYGSALQAARLVRDAGGMPALLDARLAGRISVDEAFDGDVCLLDPSCHEWLPGLDAVAVLYHGHVLAQADRGLAVWPVDRAVAWWGVAP